MENINAYFVSKITFIRYLLVILISTSSLGVLAEGENIKRLEGNWVSSGGRLDYKSSDNPRYTLEVTELGDFNLSLKNASSDCNDTDPFLFLLDEKGKLVAKNDDAYEEPCIRDSGIQNLNLDKGKYTLIAATFARYDNGDFIISAIGSKDTFTLATKQSDISCSGEWNHSASLRSQNPYNNPKYLLTVSKEQKVIIDLKSQIDNALFLLNQETEIAKNDDREWRDTNALISQRLTPGQYVIVASTFHDKETGNFNLSIKPEDNMSAKLDCNLYSSKTDQENFNAGRDATITWSENTNENAHAQPAEGGNGRGVINYTSSNPDFRVDSNGKVTFDYSGSTVITATKGADDNYYAASDSYLLTVDKADQKPLKVNDITIPYAADLLFSPDTDQIKGGSGDGKLAFEILGYRFGDPSLTAPWIPLDVVEHVKDFSKLKIVGVGEVRILAVKAETRTHKIAYATFKLKVERAKQWIEFPNITDGRIIKNISDGEFSVQAISGVWNGQEKISQGNDGITFTINNYPNNSPPVYIFDSSNRMRTTKIGKTTITATKAGNKFFEDAEANFELEVRPGEVAFTANNLYEIKNLNKVCGDSFTIDLSVDGKSLRDNRTIRESALKNDNRVSPYQGLFTFHSDNEMVAKVNEHTGKVRVVGIGSAKIAASLFGDNSIEPVASYNLHVNEKGNQSIQFKGEKSVLINVSDIGKTIKKEIIDGWGENPIEFTLEGDNMGLIDLNNASGEVKIDFEAENAPEFFDVVVVAEKPEDRCYRKAEDTYSISYHKNAIHSPKLGEKWDKEYEIKWSLPDYDDSGKKVKLYYTNFLPNEFDEILNKKSIKEVDISEGSYKWDTSALPEGDYYIVANIEGAENTINSDCNILGIEACFVTENPVEIEHDYGLAMDCSKWYNHPAELGVPTIACPSRYMALLNDNNNLVSWGRKSNSVLWSGDHIRRIYPTRTSFLGLTKYNEIRPLENSNNSLYSTPTHIFDFTSVYTAVPYNTPNPKRPSGQSFAGKREDGSIYARSKSSAGEVENVTKLITSDTRFVALKDDGSISIWSNSKRINWRDEYKPIFQKYLESQVSYLIRHLNWGSMITPVGNIKSVSENGGTKTSWDMPVGAEIYPARLSRETNFYTPYYPLKEEYPQSDDIIKVGFSCKVYHEKDSSGTIISRNLDTEVDACDLDPLSEKLLSYLQPGQTYAVRFITNDNGIDGDSRSTITNLSNNFDKSLFVRINDNNDGILYKAGHQSVRFEWHQIADSDYIDIVADNGSGTFIALNKNGEINQFTLDGQPYDRVPEGADYIKIFALKTTNGYLAMRADGSVVPWGMSKVQDSHSTFVNGLKNQNIDPYSWNEFGLSEKLDQKFLSYKGAYAFDGDPKVTVDHKNKTIKHEGNLLGQLIFVESGEVLADDAHLKAYNPTKLKPDGSENFKAVPFRCKISRTTTNATNAISLGFPNTGSESGTWVYNPELAFLESGDGKDTNLSMFLGEDGSTPKPVDRNHDTATTDHINGCDLRSIPAKAADILEPNKTYLAFPTLRIGYEAHTFSAYEVRLDSRGLYRVNNGVTFNGLSDDLIYQKIHEEQQKGDYREDKIYSSDLGFLTNKLDYWGSGRVGLKAKELKDQGVTGKIVTSGAGTAVLSKVDGSIRFLAVQNCVESEAAGHPCQNHPSDDDTGYIKIYSNASAFAALKADGTITTWGVPVFDHMKQVTTYRISDGQTVQSVVDAPPGDLVVYKDVNRGESGGPTDSGYISIIASQTSFTAIKANGEMYTWGRLENNDVSYPSNINE